MAGKPNKDIFAKATSVRDQLTKNQAVSIQKLYVDFANDIEKRAKEMQKKQTPSAQVEYQYLMALKKQIEEQSKKVTNEVYSTIRKNMNFVSDSVVSDAVDFMSGFGFDKDGLNAAMSNISQSSVNAILNGNVYKGGWNLSKALWGENEDNLRKVYQIIAQGQVEQLPYSDIADMLVEFLNPKKKLDWVGPNGKRIYGRKTDYASQRLARTLLQHTYQQTVVATVKDNPFIEKVRWVSNGSRVCDICKKRDGKLFNVDEVPLDHPNGMCVLEPVVDDNMVDDLAKWVKGEELPKKKQGRIDYFADRLGYDPNKTYKPKVKLISDMSIDEIIDNYGDKSMLKYKAPSKWYNSLPPDVQAKVSELHQSTGMKWTDWYKKNVAKFDIDDVVDDIKDVADDVFEVIDDVKFGKAFKDDDALKILAKFADDSTLEYKTPTKFFHLLEEYYSDDYKMLIEAQKKSGLNKTKFYQKYFSNANADSFAYKKIVYDSFDDDLDYVLSKLMTYYDKSDLKLPSKFELKYSNGSYSLKLTADGLKKAALKADDALKKELHDFLSTYKQMTDYAKSSVGDNIDKFFDKSNFYTFTTGPKGFTNKSKVNKIVDKFAKDNGISIEELLDEETKKIIKEANEKAEKEAAELAAKKALEEKKLKEVKEKLEKALKDAFTPEVTAKDRFNDALSFSSRNEADKYYRKLLDELWNDLSDREKYAIWEYTHNSNPINKPLSGYANGSWDRKDFVGVGKVNWDVEDKWRYLSGAFKKFAKNREGNVGYKKVIKDLTNAIQKSKTEKDVWVVRGSDENGLAGLFEGNLFSFEEIKEVINQDRSQLKMFEGIEVTNHAFTSTGIATDAGFTDNVMYKIFMPKGTNAVYAEPQSYYGHTINSEQLYEAGMDFRSVGEEAEIIIQRGTSFRINKIEVKGNKIYVEMEVTKQSKFDTGTEQTV